MQPIIKITDLTKVFSGRRSSPGILGALKSLFAKKEAIAVIKGLSLEVQAGERIAFIGPNGAGKSTTIKMLTGILHPTSGEIKVLGLIPWQDREALGFQIGTVFGQKTQLWYHLPPTDTFNLLAKIYEIPQTAYHKNLQELVQLFEIGSFLDTPVRKLSLGQRMRCEIVASLLHQPKILFLDEPTIGLDINAKLMIRGLLSKLSKEQGTTLFLTSHDTADIEQVCDRVIVLDQGTLITDSPLRELKKKYMKNKILNLITEEPTIFLQMEGVRILENEGYHFKCEVDIEVTSLSHVIEEAFKVAHVKDVSIEDTSMEEVIRLVYGKSSHV